jgi:hypothetical protein
MAASDHLGPQFHGTNAALQPGDLINPGHRPSQYSYADEAHHVFSAGTPHQAGEYASFAKMLAGMGEIPGPEESHVYEVEHTGPTEPVQHPTNPSVTYYRSQSPARVLRELPAKEWSW